MASNMPDVKMSPSKTEESDLSQKTIEDATIIWFDQYMEESGTRADVEKTKSALREINDYILFFFVPEPCLNYIKSVSKEKIFLISTGSYAVDHLDKIHQLSQIDSVFIFCADRKKYLPLKDKYSKIVDVFTKQKDLMDSLASHVQSVVKQATIFTLFDGKQCSTRYLTRQSTSFLWFHFLTNVLQTIVSSDITKAGLEEMLAHCQIYYRENPVELKNIEEFRKTYKAEDAILWYSKKSFIYKLLNKALRTEDIDVLYTFRLYITHLRTRIAHEHHRATSNTSKSSVVHLYRGLKMTCGEINQLRKHLNGLISMNGFFSTTRDLEQAMRIATKKTHQTDVVSVLVQLDVNLNREKFLFADIAQFSAYPKEQEVLFDLATTFQITHVDLDRTKDVWIVKLSDVEKSSDILSEFIKNIEKANEESNPMILFSRLMSDMGEYDKCENYLKRLLKTISPNHENISQIYFHLGRISSFGGQTQQALDYYHQALDLQKHQIAPKVISFDIARILHNTAKIYFDQKQISKALDYFEAALEMKRAVFINNPEHPSIGITLAAIALIYHRQGFYLYASEFFQQSYRIFKHSLGNDHPTCATLLNCLGIINEEFHDYEEALDCFGRALKIQQKILFSTHPLISATLNNMGVIHWKEKDYDKALICYTQALQIEQTTLSSNQLDLAETYHHLCTLYSDRSDYEKALETARCRVNILKKNFDDEHENVILAKEIMDDIIKHIDSQGSTKI